MSETIEVKVSDLVGPSLDWAVAQVESVPVAIASPQYGTDWRIYKPDFGGKYSPSTDWAVGGPLIEKHVTALNQTGSHTWYAHCEDRLGEGDAPLIAACRAIVAAKLGDTVRIPAELTEQLNPA